MFIRNVCTNLSGYKMLQSEGTNLHLRASLICWFYTLGPVADYCDNL